MLRRVEMSDIGSAQCGDVYVDESDALYRVIQTSHSVEAVAVERIDDAEKFDQVISGPVGDRAWAGFRRIHRPIVHRPGGSKDGYRRVGFYLGSPVYVDGDNFVVDGLKEMLGRAECQ